MADQKDLIQEKFVTKADNPDPEYQRLLNAYVENPFDDMRLRPEEKKKQEEEKSAPPLPAA